MKKLFLLAASLFCMTASFAQEQGDDNGFGLKLNIGLVSNAKFGQRVDEEDKKVIENEFEKRTNTPMFGLAMDSRWYVANPGKFGIAVDARWVDVSFGFSKCYYEDPTGILKNDLLLLKGKTVKADLLMPGVIGTYYIGNDMAADVFYNIGTSLAFQNFEFADEDVENAYKDIAKKLRHDIDDVDAELGLSQYLGAAFRWKVLQVGFEYNFARLKAMDWFEEDEDETWDEKWYDNIVTHRRRNNCRIFVGFKF